MTTLLDAARVYVDGQWVQAAYLGQDRLARVRTNLQPTPRLQAASGWLSILSAPAWGTWEGGFGAVLRRTSTGSARSGIQSQNALGSVGAFPTGVPMTIGVDAARGPLMLGGVTLRVMLFDGGTTQRAVASTPALLASRQRYTITLTPNGVWNRLYLDFMDAAGNADDIAGYLDRLTIEVGSSGGSYFDGDTDRAEWTGTPSASPSTLWSAG